MAVLTNEDNEFLFLDVVLNEEIQASQDITDHPLEDRSFVSDHIQRRPKTFKVEAYLSESPLANNLLILGGGEERIREAERYLENARDKLLSYTSSRLSALEDYGLTNYVIRVSDARKRVMIELDFKEMTFSSNETVSLPPERRKPSQKKKDDNGENKTKNKELIATPGSLIAGGFDFVAGEYVTSIRQLLGAE